MTNADVANFIADVRQKHGREIDRTDAKLVLGARELLAVEPYNDAAKQSLVDFAKFLRTGNEVDMGLACFLIPETWTLHTVEEVAEMERIRREYLTRHPEARSTT